MVIGPSGNWSPLASSRNAEVMTLVSDVASYWTTKPFMVMAHLCERILSCL